MKTKLAIMTLVISGAFCSLAPSLATAQERGVAASVKCVQETGYGRYEGEGASKALARTEATKQCFDHQLAMYESLRHRLPTDDEADDILNQCVNICP